MFIAINAEISRFQIDKFNSMQQINNFRRPNYRTTTRERQGNPTPKLMNMSALWFPFQGVNPNRSVLRTSIIALMKQSHLLRRTKKETIRLNCIFWVRIAYPRDAICNRFFVDKKRWRRYSHSGCRVLQFSLNWISMGFTVACRSLQVNRWIGMKTQFGTTMTFNLPHLTLKRNVKFACSEISVTRLRGEPTEWGTIEVILLRRFKA